MREIILASASPRRQQLLTQAEITYEVIVSNTDETFPAGMPLHEAPVYIASHKAKAVRAQCSESTIIIAADTVVIINDEILGKPSNEAEAVAMLQKLNGNTHQVVTGVSILHNGIEVTFSDTTLVTFHELNNEQMAYYAQQYKPFDKAGGYAIQEWIGVVGIKRIEGCFYNVMGLPVSKVLQALSRM